MARGGGIRVTGLDEMIAVCDRLADTPSQRSVLIWRDATSHMFGNSQQAVHVDTGELKSSGRFHAERMARADILGQVSYDAGHATYEFRRGGSHDALTRAYVASHREFQSAMLRIMAAQMKG